MKKIFFVFVAVFGIMLNAQEAPKHIPESTDLVGFWQQCFLLKNSEGNKILRPSGNYKVINPDGTFYTFMIVPQNNGAVQIPVILQYGTYKIQDDGQFTEHIIKHAMNPSFSNTNSELRYKKIEGDDTIVQEYRNENKVWIPEIWRRVSFKDMSKKTNLIF